MKISCVLVGFVKRLDLDKVMEIPFLNELELYKKNPKYETKTVLRVVSVDNHNNVTEILKEEELRQDGKVNTSVVFHNVIFTYIASLKKIVIDNNTIEI